METLRDRMEADLKIGCYSPSTRKIYLLYARLFAKYHLRSPNVMGKREIRRFLLHLVAGQRRSRTISNALLVIAFDHHILSSVSRPSGLRAWKR